MLPRRFVFTFHAGLALSVVLLVAGRAAQMQWLLAVGVVHVLGLFAIGRRLRAPSDSLVIDTLRTTGFLHTLIGLASAVATLAGETSQGDGLQGAVVFAPLGEAMLPHFFGVWFGHQIRMANSRADVSIEDMTARLVEVGELTLRLLGDSTRRLGDLNREIGSLAGECEKVVLKTGRALNSLPDTARSTADRAKDLQTSVDEVAKATAQIATVHEQLIGLMNAQLSRSARKAGGGE